jgi:putative oxidoreductase
MLLNTQPSPALLAAGLLIFRVLAGFALLRVHGWEKVANYAAEVQSIPDPFGLGGPVNVAIAIFSDVGCAGLVMLGLFTRPAAFMAMSTTLVGLLFVHLHDDWHGRDVPLVYSIMFLTLLILGPGRYSLDHWLTGRLGRRNRPADHRASFPTEVPA